MKDNTDINKQVIRTAKSISKTIEKAWDEWDEMMGDVYRAFNHTDDSIMFVDDNFHDTLSNLRKVVRLAEKDKL